MIKYKTCGLKKLWLPCPEITPIECERESEHSIWLAGGRRLVKVTEYEEFHNSFAEAKRALVLAARKNKYRHEQGIFDAEKCIAEIEALTEDNEAV